MPNRNRMLFGLTLIILMAAPLYAHRLALKDGQTIQFENYRVTENKLFYTTAGGKEVAISLADVDLDRTQQLNAQESIPLDLPGLTHSSSHTANGTEPSLAEIARQQRKSASGAAAKRVLTDDDVTHSSVAEPAAPAVASPNPQGRLEQVQKIVDNFTGKTSAQLANGVVGDSQFPGRDAWEQKLYVQGQRVLKLAQAYVERARKLEAITDYNERDAAIDIAKNLDWQLNLEQDSYTQVSAEGTQKAAEWEKRSR